MFDVVIVEAVPWRLYMCYSQLKNKLQREDEEHVSMFLWINCISLVIFNILNDVDIKRNYEQILKNSLNPFSLSCKKWPASLGIFRY